LHAAKNADFVIQQYRATAERGKQALVSVIMNCFNGEKYLREAIDSVLVQTYENWEIIFWDNQSTDRSAEIFNSYADPRLKYFYAPKHTWLYEARNYAIEKASGEFIAFLDVDDWWVPSKLERQIPLFLDPEVGLVCGNYWIASEVKNKRWIRYKRPLPTGWILNDLLKDQFVGLLTVVVRRSALEALSYQCDPRYHIIGDFDLVVRLSLHWKLDCAQEPIAFYRLHDTNESARHKSREVDELECWVAEMSKVEAIRSCRNWDLVKNNPTYLKAVNQILLGDKHAAHEVLSHLPWGKKKIKLLLFLVLPTVVVRRLKN
jgi:glycosyltransferase involved in cell wall biosynthesis